MPRIIYVLLVTSVAFFSGYAFAQSPDPSKESAEVVVAGKRYPSLRAYKLQRLKDDLGGVLSPAQLREFSAAEIVAVIHELQTQPPVTAQPPAREQTVPAEDPQAGQMEEMLKDYRAAHPGAPSLEVDPQKVKTVIIKPPSQGRQ